MSMHNYKPETLHFTMDEETNRKLHKALTNFSKLYPIKSNQGEIDFDASNDGVIDLLLGQIVADHLSPDILDAIATMRQHKGAPIIVLENAPTGDMAPYVLLALASLYNPDWPNHTIKHQVRIGQGVERATGTDIGIPYHVEGSRNMRVYDDKKGNIHGSESNILFDIFLCLTGNPNAHTHFSKSIHHLGTTAKRDDPDAFSMALKPGTAVLFDNTRVTHAREPAQTIPGQQRILMSGIIGGFEQPTGLAASISREDARTAARILGNPEYVTKIAKLLGLKAKGAGIA